MKPIRILIANSQPMMQLELHSLISSKPNIRCVGEAKNVSEILKMCETLKPDLLLIDLSLPELYLPKIVPQLHNQVPQVNILIFSTYKEVVDIQNLIGLGVSGFVNEEETLETWECAIDAISKGDLWFSKETMQKLTPEDTSPPLASDDVYLTNRELDVLRLLVQGHSNKKIAQQLCISVPAVRFHLRNIYEKKGSHSRTEIVAWAIHRRLVIEELSAPIGNDRE